jgi:hypothetical protein
MVVEMSFTKPNAPRLMEKVAEERKSTITERKSGSPPNFFYPPIDESSFPQLSD